MSAPPDTRFGVAVLLGVSLRSLWSMEWVGIPDDVLAPSMRRGSMTFANFCANRNYREVCYDWLPGGDGVLTRITAWFFFVNTLSWSTMRPMARAASHPMSTSSNKSTRRSVNDCARGWLRTCNALFICTKSITNYAKKASRQTHAHAEMTRLRVASPRLMSVACESHCPSSLLFKKASNPGSRALVEKKLVAEEVYLRLAY